MILFWASILCAIAMKWRDFMTGADLVKTPGNEWLAAHMPSLLFVICCMILSLEVDRKERSWGAAIIFFICASYGASRAFLVVSSIFF